MSSEYDVFLGLDVGKTAHHGCALSADGASSMITSYPKMKPRCGLS